MFLPVVMTNIHLFSVVYISALCFRSEMMVSLTDALLDGLSHGARVLSLKPLHLPKRRPTTTAAGASAAAAGAASDGRPTTSAAGASAAAAGAADGALTQIDQLKASSTFGPITIYVYNMTRPSVNEHTHPSDKGFKNSNTHMHEHSEDALPITARAWMNDIELNLPPDDICTALYSAESF